MKISPAIFENTEVAFQARSNTDLQKAKWLFTLVGNNFLVNTGSSLAGLALNLGSACLTPFQVYRLQSFLRWRNF
jgi:hypothetical protein